MSSAESPEPRRLFLFSGHMIDAPGRARPRFPPAREPEAAAAIGAQLDELGAGATDLALCGGACGGDLLFAEAALARGLALELHIALDEPAFLAASVEFAGAAWRRRYFAVKAHPNAELHVLAEELGPPARDEDPYERANRALLERALGGGAAALHFICLWDGGGGDGPGGTRHMLEAVRRAGGAVHWLDTRALWRA